MSFAVWLTGLSGSGKSAVAKQLLLRLHERGVEAAVLESDILRTQITPFPRYDEAERDAFYATLAYLGTYIVSQGKPVIFDATANRQAYRDRARKGIARFAEAHVSTPLEICAARNTKGLYKEGAATTLPGVHVPYEAPRSPELVLSGHGGTPAQGAAEIMGLLERRGWLEP
jgi:adenylylsulfate kinase-like enzyme